MMRDMLSGVLALVMGAAAMYIVYLSLTGSAEAESSELPKLPALDNPLSSDSSSAPECAENSEMPCTLSNGCTGRQVCLNGEWIGCIAPVPACEPGAVQSCAFQDAGGACSAGMRECNECGTGWGECS